MLERQRQQYLQHHGRWRGDDDTHHELPEPHQQLSGTMSLLIGGLSGAIGPQKQNTTKNANSTPKYTGLVQACFKIANEEGARALWKGVTPRLMRIVPGKAITFRSYEAVCRWL